MKKCKDCKKEYTPRYRGTIAVPRCYKCTLAKEREKKKKAAERRRATKARQREKKKNSIQTLKKTLDTVFSKYIRQRDKGICVTCGKKDDWQKMQNGHYVSRTHNATRFDERNCNCQCVGCNMFKSGNMDEYTLFIIQKYGEDMLHELNRLKHTTKKFTSEELKGLIDHYNKKLKEF